MDTRKQLITIVGIVLTVGLSTLAVIMVTRLAGGPSLAINQITTNKMSTFDVTGDSKVTTVPDQAEARVGITVNENTVKAAQDRANSVMNSINEQLATLGIEKKDIKTENYSLYPNYDYSTGSGQRITGYVVNANLVITIREFDKVNQAIDLATSAGANQIGGISFTLSDDRRDEVEQEARQQAIENAKEKAVDLASLAGMRLGKIVNVYESPTDLSYPMPYAADRAMGMGGVESAAPTNVEPGSTSYNYTVTLSYETL